MIGYLLVDEAIATFLPLCFSLTYFVIIFLSKLFVIASFISVICKVNELISYTLENPRVTCSVMLMSFAYIRQYIRDFSEGAREGTRGGKGGAREGD